MGAMTVATALCAQHQAAKKPKQPTMAPVQRQASGGPPHSTNITIAPDTTHATHLDDR